MLYITNCKSSQSSQNLLKSTVTWGWGGGKFCPTPPFKRLYNFGTLVFNKAFLSWQFYYCISKSWKGLLHELKTETQNIEDRLRFYRPINC